MVSLEKRPVCPDTQLKPNQMASLSAGCARHAKRLRWRHYWWRRAASPRVTAKACLTLQRDSPGFRIFHPVLQHLRAFCDAGLLQEVTETVPRSYFDTKTPATITNPFLFGGKTRCSEPQTPLGTNWWIARAADARRCRNRQRRCVIRLRETLIPPSRDRGRPDSTGSSNFHTAKIIQSRAFFSTNAPAYPLASNIPSCLPDSASTVEVMGCG